VVEIAGGQQNLCGVNVVLVETLLIGPHEKILPDCRTCLQLPQVGGARCKAQAADSGADGPGTD
jgi:hypothetical protein